MALTLEEANALVIHRHDPDGLYQPLDSREARLHHQARSEWTSRPRIFDFTHHPSGSEIIGLINGPDDTNYFKTDREILRHPAGIRSVVIVGSSGAGKSKLYNDIREIAGTPGFERVRTFKRYVTRAGREETDKKDGNIPVTSDVFLKMVSDGMFRMWWTRDLGKKELAYYGIPFESEQGDAPDSGHVLLIPGNNALISAQTQLEPGELVNALFVSVARQEEAEREQAYVSRAGSAEGDEQAKRMADLQGLSVLYSDLILLNDGETDRMWRYFEKILKVVNTAVNSVKVHGLDNRGVS